MLSPARVEVTLGENIGVVRKAIYSDEIRSEWEVALSSPVAIGAKLQMDLKVFEDSSTPISYSARSEILFLDETMLIVCKAMACRGPSTGSGAQQADTWLQFHPHSLKAMSG